MRTSCIKSVGATLLGVASLLALLLLTASPAGARGAAHTRLVFAASGKLWAASPQGRGLHCFARIPGDTNDISASENGRRIAIITHEALPYPKQGSIRRIYLWRRGHKLKLLLRLHTVADSEVAISADGTRIAYGKDDEIWSMNAGGGDRKQLTNDARRAFDPAFAPSGKNLFFARQSSMGGTVGIFRKPFTTPFHSEIRLTPNGQYNLSPVVSSRHLVAFMQLGQGGAGGTPDRLKVMQANGSKQRTVLRSNDPRFTLDPDFSPNGRAIAYLRLVEVNGDRSPRRYSLRTVRTSGKNPKVAVAHLKVRPRGLQWTRIP